MVSSPGGLVLGHPCWEPQETRLCVGAWHHRGWGSPCSGAVSARDLEATLPPYSFPFSWLLVWLFIAYLDE